MRRAARADINQPDIVRKLRSLGATIWHTHTLGRGGPDIVIGYCGVNVLAEIKRDTLVIGGFRQRFRQLSRQERNLLIRESLNQWRLPK